MRQCLFALVRQPPHWAKTVSLPMPHWMGHIVNTFKVTCMILNLINEMSHMSLVTSTTETIIFRTKRVMWENILTAGEKKKITFSQSLQTGKYLWVCLICFAFFGKSKRQFSLQRKRPFVFANASHPFLPSKKLFSQEKTAQAEIKGSTIGENFPFLKTKITSLNANVTWGTSQEGR